MLNIICSGLLGLMDSSDSWRNDENRTAKSKWHTAPLIKHQFIYFLSENPALKLKIMLKKNFVTISYNFPGFSDVQAFRMSKSSRFTSLKAVVNGSARSTTADFTYNSQRLPGRKNSCSQHPFTVIVKTADLEVDRRTHINVSQRYINDEYYLLS